MSKQITDSQILRVIHVVHQAFARELRELRLDPQDAGHSLVTIMLRYLSIVDKNQEHRKRYK